MLPTLLPLLLLLLPSLPPTTALDPGWTLLNLTHTPTLLGNPTTPARNGSITFTLAGSAAHSAHACAHTFAAPTAAAGGPIACSDAWPDLLYYWRDGGGGGGRVEVDVWYAYLDCTPDGGAVSESGKVELPAVSGVEEEGGGGGRRWWGSVFVPAQEASSTAWYPGQYEEVCLKRE
ncbi:hypothetical protein BKCO1_4700063 [Neofusicoccum parvum]|uniref:Uncharacterized protein n=1 Tax=Neofusicoccum parvum TaxID=310453 RepID=A0ACB5SFZ9_9PEZI|nr:hypothetical protein BKCO1_4700063 [Neofusicoccum parvum]